MDVSATLENPPNAKAPRKSSKKRRTEAKKKKLNDQQQHPPSDDPQHRLREITALEQKLEANQGKIDALISQLKAIESSMNLVENRDEYWNLLQAEKRIDELEGPQRKWFSLMKRRDSLGRLRTKLSSRLADFKRGEGSSVGSFRNEKGGSKKLDPVLEVEEEEEASGRLIRGAKNDSPTGNSGATPSGTKWNIERKEMEKDHDLSTKGKGKTAMTNTIVESDDRAEEKKAEETDDNKEEEEEDSDSSTEFILNPRPRTGPPIWV